MRQIYRVLLSRRGGVRCLEVCMYSLFRYKRRRNTGQNSMLFVVFRSIFDNQRYDTKCRYPPTLIRISKAATQCRGWSGRNVSARQTRPNKLWRRGSQVCFRSDQEARAPDLSCHNSLSPISVSFIDHATHGVVLLYSQQLYEASEMSCLEGC